MTDRYYAACCQTDFSCPGDRDEIAERTRRMCAIVEQTIVGYEPFHDVRLLVFPPLDAPGILFAMFLWVISGYQALVDTSILQVASPPPLTSPF